MTDAMPPRSEAAGRTRQLVSMAVGGQELGVGIHAVRDILGAQSLARVPLAAAEIAGVLNLRGRIVTAIDLRRRLGIDGIPPAGEPMPVAQQMNVVVEHQGDLYSLLVDRVGDILDLPDAGFDSDAGNLPPAWRTLAHGVHRLDRELLVELDIAAVLDLRAVA